MSAAQEGSSCTTKAVAAADDSAIASFAGDTAGAISPIHVDGTGLEKLIKTEKRPLLVDFWATWCGPCRRLGPELEKLAKEYGGKVVVAKVDVMKNRAVAQKYNVKALPTVLIIVNGKVQKTIVGLNARSVYKSVLDRFLKNVAI